MNKPSTQLSHASIQHVGQVKYDLQKVVVVDDSSWRPDDLERVEAEDEL